MAGAVLSARLDLVGPTVVVNGDDWIDPKIIQQFSRAIKTTPDKVIFTGIKSHPGLTGGFFSLQGTVPAGHRKNLPREKNRASG